MNEYKTNRTRNVRNYNGNENGQERERSIKEREQERYKNERIREKNLNSDMEFFFNTFHILRLKFF